MHCLSAPHRLAVRCDDAYACFTTLIHSALSQPPDCRGDRASYTVTFSHTSPASQVSDAGSAIVGASRFSRNAAREGGALHVRGGTAAFAGCSFSANAAGLHGGVGLLRPDGYPNPLIAEAPTVGSPDAPPGAVLASGTVFAAPSTASFLHCAFSGNRAVGSTVDPGAGGAFYVEEAASAQFDGCV